MQPNLYINDIYPYKDQLVTAHDKATYSYRQLQQVLKYSPYRELCTVKLNSKKDVVNQEINRINDVLRVELSQIDTFLEWLETHKDDKLNVRYSKLDDEVMLTLSNICIEYKKGDYDMTMVNTYVTVSGNHPSNTYGEIEWFYVDHIYNAWKEERIDIETLSSRPTENFSQPEILYQNTGGIGGQQIMVKQEEDDTNETTTDDTDPNDCNEPTVDIAVDDGSSYEIYSEVSNYERCILALKSFTDVAIRWLAFILAILNGEFPWWSRLRRLQQHNS